MSIISDTLSKKCKTYISNQRYYRYYIGITRISKDPSEKITDEMAHKAAIKRAKNDKRETYINPTNVDVLIYGCDVNGKLEREVIDSFRKLGFKRTLLNKGNGGEGVKPGINVLYIRCYTLTWYQIVYDGLCDLGNKIKSVIIKY